MKLCDILKVKNTLVKSVYCVMMHWYNLIMILVRGNWPWVLGTLIYKAVRHRFFILFHLQTIQIIA